MTRPHYILGILLSICVGFIVFTSCNSGQEQAAQDLVNKAGIKGGLVVYLGCENPQMITAVRRNDSYMVHALDPDLGRVESARAYIKRKGLYGEIYADRLNDQSLPYIDNLVNLVIADRADFVSKEEIQRVLSPQGVALIKEQDEWIKITKPQLQHSDEWTHYLYDPSGNPVSNDLCVDLPRRFQWLGSPTWARHHDHMASMSALVSSGGRIFYIMDQGSRASILLPAQWSLIARDAFNGKILWKRPIAKWHHHLWPLKSGPAQLPRRLVADKDRIFVTPEINAPVHMMDAATGETLKEYPETKGTEEILFSDGVLYVLINKNPFDSVFSQIKKFKSYYGKEFWQHKDQNIMAVDVATGTLLWRKEDRVLPVTMALNDKQLFYHNGDRVVSLDRKTGQIDWLSKPIARSEKILAFFSPILIAGDDVVLFAGGETAGMQRGSWYREGEDTITGLDAKTGKILWTEYHPPSGYRSPEDVFVVDNTVWFGETTSGEVPGEFFGLDLYTGEMKSSFMPDVANYWFHHRCYRGKATKQFLLTSRNGIEYINPKTQHWEINHWVRGGCLYGIMPANGLVYAPPHACACYPEAKLNGFAVLAAHALQSDFREPTGSERLKKGPAFGQQANDMTATQTDWPTFRQNGKRNGASSSTLPNAMQTRWKTNLDGRLSGVTVAAGKVFLAKIDAHTVCALNEQAGDVIWEYTVGGRVDSPPTFYKGSVIFGCADGRVYCLRASDGELVWQFLAAPADRRMMAYEQIESVWPVHGSVLVRDDEVCFVAGRSMFLDKGMRFYRLDAKTGQQLSVTVMDEQNPHTGENLQSDAKYLTMPVALSDILSSDDEYIYMRSQRFDLDGKRQKIRTLPDELFGDFDDQNVTDNQYMHQDKYMKFLENVQQNTRGNHLFCPSGFLDDSWYHRTYWVYGKHYMGGWNGYFLSGKFLPTGRILTHDDDTVFGFGRKNEYYRWTTQMEYHLFATPKVHDIGTKPITEGRRKGHLTLDNEKSFEWSLEVSLLVRAMALSADKIVVAGPPDVLDEEVAINQLTSADTQASIEKQQDAMNGKLGGVLQVISKSDGNLVAEYNLDSPPVWDGMAVANNQVYMPTLDGHVICMGE